MSVWQSIPLAVFALVHADAAPAAADAVPVLNIDPSCRAAASHSTVENYLDVCRATERKARDELVKLWPNVTAADKSECVPLARLGGQPTYTELLTCLEMARDVRTVRGRTESATTGQGTR